MAEFTYRSTIYGHHKFTVADAGGIVEKKGKQLAIVGGYLLPGVAGQKPLLANAANLEGIARRWWKHRTDHLEAMGRAANGVEP